MQEPDYRHEHAQVPQPADHEPRPRVAQADEEYGDHEEGERGDDHVHAREPQASRVDDRRMGVVEREPLWPEVPAQVLDVGERRVREPLDEGDALERADGSPRTLGEHGDERRDGHEQPEGPLFQEPGATEVGLAGSRAGGGLLVSRPQVPQTENRRPAHQHRLRHQAQSQSQRHLPHPSRGRLLPVACVGQEHPEEEHAAQHILALGDPGHRLDPQRVNREDERHEGAAPPHPGQRRQCSIAEQRRQGVQEHADQVMLARVQAEDLAVQHVRKPGERVPVGRVGLGEGPDDAVGAEAVAYARVLGDVGAVVVGLEEAMVGHLGVQHERDQEEDEPDPARGRVRAPCLSCRHHRVPSFSDGSSFAGFDLSPFLLPRRSSRSSRLRWHSTTRVRDRRCPGSTCRQRR